MWLEDRNLLRAGWRARVKVLKLQICKSQELKAKQLVASNWEGYKWCINIVTYYMQCMCVCVCARAQSHLTLCDPMDCRSPVFSIRGIFQARILEWVAISYSRLSSQPRDRTCVSCFSCIGRWILYHCSTTMCQALCWIPFLFRCSKPLQNRYYIVDEKLRSRAVFSTLAA